MTKMPKKISRIQSEAETNGDASNSFVAFVGGKPTLVKYQDGFVGDDEEDSDMPLIERVARMDGENIRELTEAEEEEIMNSTDLSFEEKVDLIQKHEERINRQMDRAVQVDTYIRGVDEDE